MAVNSNNVFATVTPLQGNVSDWVDGQEKMNMAQREEERLVAKIKQDKKDKDEAIAEKRREDFKNPKFETTGVKSIDDATLQFMTRTLQEVSDNKSKIYAGMPAKEYSDLTIRQMKLESMPEQVSLATKAYTTKVADLEAKLKSKSIKPTAAMLSMAKNLNDGNYTILFDEETLSPMVASWDKDDKDNPKFTTFQELVGGEAFGQEVPNVDWTGKLQELGSKLGYVVRGTDNGYTKNVKTKVDDKLLTNTAREALYTPDGGYSDLAKSQLWEMGVKDGFDDVPKEKLDLLLQNAKDVMAGTRDNKDVTDTTIPAYTGSGDKEDKKKPTLGVVETPPIYAKYKKDIAKGYKTVAINGKSSVPTLAITNPNYKKGSKIPGEMNDAITLSNVSIQSYSVRTDKSGKRSIVAELYYDDLKGSSTSSESYNDTEGGSEKTTDRTPVSRKVKLLDLSEKNAFIFARQLGFNNVNEMKDAARVSQGDSFDTEGYYNSQMAKKNN